MRGKGFGKYKRLAEREGRTGGVGEGRKSVGGSPLPSEGFSLLSPMLRPFKINRGYFPALALGKKSCLPSSWKLAMAFWVLGLIHQLMNFLAASCLSLIHISEPTRP